MKRYLGYLSIIIFLMSFIGFFSWQKVFAKTAGEYLEEGAKFEESKDYSGALGVYMKGIVERPKNYNLFFRIADIYQIEGRHFEAVEYFIIAALKGYEMGLEWYDMISRSYHEMGKERFFTKELCTRLIYNTMVCMELEKGVLGQDDSEQRIKQLEEYLEYFDKSHKGSISYVLPQDIFGEREKSFYIERARKKIESYYKNLKE
ncbi:MAG: hypothetical protein ABH848_01255 [Candidatus Omnitrophota bacterium]